jgi:hypothetical protein
MPGTRARRHRRSMKILLRVALVGAVLLGGFLFRDRLSGNAGDLQVGDCFDVPRGDRNVEDVLHHPCSEPHIAEVVFVGDHPAAKGTPWTDSLLGEFARSSCVPAFDAYTGTTGSESLDIGAIYPLVEDWDGGDREIICYAYRVDRSLMSGSLKVS